MIPVRKNLKNPLSNFIYSIGSLTYAYGYTNIGKAFHASGIGTEIVLQRKPIKSAKNNF
jgi:hypothetical protein